MTNREFYKEKILDLTFDRCYIPYIAMKIGTTTLCSCKDVNCADCLFNAGNNSCIIAFNKWLDEEYIEPCPFVKGELVEVSDDGNIWYLRYFYKIYINDNMKRKYATYADGCKENRFTSSWEYCRKYGTLGGLVKEENKIEIDVARKIWDIARISPDYGNAVMDVIGYNAYCKISNLVGSCENKEEKDNG